MDLLFILVSVLVVLVIFGMSPLTRRSGESAERAMRSTAHGADVDRQFTRPHNEHDLL